MSKKRRMLIMAGLVMSMTAVTVPAAVMTGCTQKTPTVTEITGEYYDADNDVLLTLDGSDHSYVLTVDGVEKSGEYSYDGKTLTLTVDGDYLIAIVDTATNQITLTYDGKDCTLSVTQTKTVSFDTDGGTAVKTQKLADGDKAERPAEPVKDGYLFIDWYADKNFGVKFDFGKAITANTTVYARFVAIDANAKNYTVTFDAGEGATLSQTTVTTVNGKVYHLPVPVKAGAKFEGWWISHYGTRDKLTYKYVDQQLTEDTTFFAVWDTDLNGAPAVSVTSSGVSFSAGGVNNTYRVVIYDHNNQEIIGTTTGSTSYPYDFTTKEAGDYVVEVTLNGKTTKAYFKNKGLDRVSGFRYEGSVLYFDAVDNATDYYITAVCGNPDHVVSEVRLDTNNYDFSACEMCKGGIKFTVKAAAEGYVTSSSEYTVEKNLGAVTNLTVDSATETLKWDAVENAASYAVEITNGEQTNTYNVTECKYDLRKLTGEIGIKVTPKTRGYNSPDATETSYTKNTIATPSDLLFTGESLTWDAVDGASNYIVKINDKEFTTQTNSLPATHEYFDGVVGTDYKVSVQAVTSDAGKQNSLFTDAITIKSGEMGNIVYSNYHLSWDGVLDAVKYGVMIDGGEEVIVTGANRLPVSFDKKGATEIKVRCYTEGDVASEWKSITVDVHEVKINALGGNETVSGEEFVYHYLGADDVLTLPTASKTGYTFAGWYNTAGGAADGGQKYGATATFSEDTEVFAYWNANTYKVTLSPTDGALESGSENKTVEVKFGSPFNLETPQHNTGALAFDGWYTEINGAGRQITDANGKSIGAWITANDDLVIYPKWIEIFDYKLSTDAVSGEEYYSVTALSTIKNMTRARVPAIHEGKPVKILDGDCFKNWRTLIRVEIPDTVTKVELGEYGYDAAGSAFSGCNALETIEVYHVAGNRDVTYFSQDGVLYRRQSEDSTEASVSYCPYNKTGTVYFAKTLGGVIDGDDVGEYTLTSIPTNVLAKCRFEKVYIPSSVVSIGENAFMSCNRLTDLVFRPATEEGETVSPLIISKNAFKNCLDLATITFPKRLADFNRESFDGCGDLAYTYVSDEEKVDGVGEHYASKNGLLCNVEKNTILFAGRGVKGTMEEPFVIPDGITTIGEEAFLRCTKIRYLVIPGYVTTISNKAFMRCSNLTSIKFEGDKNGPELTIGDYAFCAIDVQAKSFNEAGSVNSVLEEITLPANLVKLGTGAFAGCPVSLKKVTVECDHPDNSDKKINYANDVFSVVLYNDKGGIAYTGNSGVTEVNLSAGCPVFEIGGVFGKKVATVTVAEGNPNYTSVDGVLYNADVTSILYYPIAKEGAFVIPDTVTTLGAGVFSGRTGLTEITISANVTTIGDSAFESCSKLQRVIFAEPEQGTDAVPITIGDNAFYACNNSAFNSIEIPSRCTSIGVEAFRNCAYLKTVTLNEGLETIGEHAFWYCYALESINIPASVTRMGKYDDDGNLTAMGVFDVSPTFISETSYGKLASINVAEGNTAFKSVDGVLYLLGTPASTGTTEGATEGTETPVEKVPTDLLVCPAGKEGKVEIPATVHKLWAYAFYGTTKLDEVSFAEGFEGELVIEDNVFTGSSIAKVSLPEGLGAIKESMFAECKTLKEVVIPSTVESIGKKAFYKCLSLESITFAPTPAGQTPVPLVLKGTEEADLTKLTDSRFGSDSIIYNCKKLTSLELPERTTEIGVCALSGYWWDNQGSGGVSKEPSFLTTLTLPSTLTKIGKYAFGYSPDLKTVTFTDAVAGGSLTIGDGAFLQCAIESLTLPNTLTNIGTKAFYYNKFTSLKMPKSLETIDVQAFSNCSALESVEFEADSRLTKIETNAFLNCKKLSSFNFDALTSLEEIGTSAFSSCALTSVVFTDKNKLTKINASAFKDNKPMTTLVLPASIQMVDDSAFSGCTLLNSVTFLTKEVKLDADGNVIAADDTTTAVAKTEQRSDFNYLGKNCFKQTALKRFDFPISTSATGSIDIDDGYQFEGCEELTTVSLSRSVTDITNLFAKCTSIETIEIAPDSQNFKTSTDANVPFILNVDGDAIMYGYAAVPTAEGGVYTLPEGFTTISARAFEGQSGIKKIVLPKSLQTIGQYAFTNCRQLEEVEFATGTVLTEIGNYAFDGCTSLKSITVPNSVTTIGDYAFTRCNSLTNISVGTSVSSLLHSIGKYVFKYCTSLTTVDIWGTPTFGYNTTASKADLYRESYAFSGCPSLTTVNIHNKATLGNYLFDDCPALKTVVLSDDIDQLPKAMFDNTCTAFDTMKVYKNGVVTGADGVVTLPSAVTKLGYFNSATDTYLYYGDVFTGCSAITKVVLPSTIEYIGENTFKNCSSLATVCYSEGGVEKGDEKACTLPAGIKQFGSNSFQNTAVEYVDLSQFGDFSEAMGLQKQDSNNALFQDCVALKTVILSDAIVNLNNQYLFKNCTALKTIKYRETATGEIKGEDNVATFWEGLAYIKHGSYSPFINTGLEKVVLPASYRNMDNYEAGKHYCSTKTGTTSTNTSITSSYTTAASIFKDCASLHTVILTDQMFSIGANVFENCTALKTVKYLDTTTNQIVGEDNVVTLPATLAIIGKAAFKNTGITKLVTPSEFVDPGLTNKSDAAVTINGGKQLLADEIFANCAHLAEVDLGYTSVVKFKLFQNCAELKKVTFNKNITALGANMFENCTALDTIDIAPDGETANEYNEAEAANLSNIGTLSNYAFHGCTSLKKVILKNGLTAMSVTQLFDGCTSLTTVDTAGDTENNLEGRANLSGITTVGGTSYSSTKVYTFRGTAIKEVYAPRLVTWSHNYMFADCAELEKVTLSKDLKNLTTGTFQNCAKLKTIETDGDANNAEGVVNLANITRFTTTKSNNATATSHCSKETFQNCTSITTVLLPSLNTTHFTKSYNDSYMFDGCSGLTSVTLGANATEIGDYTFRGTGLTSYEVGAAVTQIGDGAFADCSSLTAITVNSANTTFKSVDGALYTADGQYLVCFPAGKTGAFTLADGAVGVQDGALAGYAGTTKEYTLPVMTDLPVMTGILEGTGIEKVIIPEGVQTIEASAFRGLTSIKEVVIPSTVTTIGKAAFANCTSLEKVTFSAGLDGSEEVALTLTAGTNDGASSSNEKNMGVFAGCTALKSITLPERLTEVTAYTFYGSGLTSATLPSTIQSIGNYAFKNCASLASVNIPTGVTYLGFYAFQNTALVTVEIPASVTAIGATTGSAGTWGTTTNGYVFSGCASLTTVTLPSTLTRMGRNNFENCTSLKTVNYRDADTGAIVGGENQVTLPDGIETIGNYQFFGCTALSFTEFTLNTKEGATIDEIGDNIGTYMFSGCTGLTNVTVNGNLLLIPGYTFADCTELTSVALNVPAVQMNGSVFKGCVKLVSVQLPATIESLGGSTFSGCSSLASLTLPAALTTLGSSEFNGCTSLTGLVIPETVINVNGGTALNSSGLFTGWTSDQTVTIKCNALELINWTGLWYHNTEANIVFELASAPAAPAE